MFTKSRKLRKTYFNKKGSMLFCDSCDKGYHMNCHIPKISEQPKDSKNKITDISILGKWVCHQCSSDNKTEDADTDSSGVSSEQRNVIVRGRIALNCNIQMLYLMQKIGQLMM